MEKKSFLTNDRVTLAYFDVGEGIPVVLINGYSGPAVLWDYQIKGLVKAGYRVIAFDRRNHGASENPDFGQRMSRHGQDIHELLQHLDLEQPILVGQSMGASAVFAYLSLYGDEAVRAIVDVDQTPKMINTDQWQCGMYNLEKENMATFFDAPIPDGYYLTPPKDFKEYMMSLISSYPQFDAEITRPLLLDHEYADWLDIFPKLEKPALFLAGRNSPYWPCEYAIETAKLCKNGQAVIIEECGHIMHLERPEETLQAFLDFFATTDGKKS